jgi:hypothetical protein
MTNTLLSKPAMLMTIRARIDEIGITFAKLLPLKMNPTRVAQTRRRALITASSAKIAQPPESNNMSPQPHEGPAEQDRLSGSVSPVVTEPERNDCARQLLSGFSHRCRNQLNGIKMSLYLFRREARGKIPECWDEIERSYRQVESLFDNLQAIYRPTALTMVRCSLGQLMTDHEPILRSSLRSKGRALGLEPPEQESAGDFDPIQLGIGLDALAKWRAEAGESKSHTRIAWRTFDGFFEICWEEFPAEFGHGPSTTAREGGADVDPRPCRRVESLAELLVSRIIAAHGGRLEKSCETSLRWILRWPLHQA